ncbi:hypothetical protein P5G65_13405 [Paenibacillus chondroitinus]|uniref:Uncharacterized protein n=1 Tax=Paenibacillus chondroitinus TaxID=59842 RepID=A0ABU6DBW8_9BACL|nr:MULTISPECIES: hypothetical protein [Paenibacillus]MCY9657480.1 hypothetical protein [Paenibacillus anseongense]MEB4794900.1 hypothetical protein [Paenibacillus chondroitinus]
MHELDAKPQIDLTARGPVSTPKETGTCADWILYFDKQYANSKVYNAFSVEELYMRAWGQLNQFADDWELTIRGIYDIQVVLYLTQLCDALADAKSGMYDFFYNAGYFFSKITKHSQGQLTTVLRSIDMEHAQERYSEHLKELAGYVAVQVFKESREARGKWFEISKLLWSGLLYEKELIADELVRLRKMAGERGRSQAERETAVMALAHFDMLSGEDENAWDRVLTGTEVIEPGDWFGYLRDFVHEEKWDRLLKWLRWLGHSIRKEVTYEAAEYFDLWEEAAAGTGIDEEYRRAMVEQLPGSYRHYARFLLGKEEYRAWADLMLCLSISPLDIDSNQLKMVEKADAHALLPLYHYAIDEILQVKNRESYKQGVKLLKKLAAAYKKLKQTPRFEAYLVQLIKQYSRYRAFQEELRKGKLLL